MTKPYLHVILLSSYPAIFLWANNQGEASLMTALWPMLALVGIGLLLWLFLGIIIRKWKAAALFVSLFMLLSFSFGHIIPTNSEPAAKTIGWVVWVLAILFLLFYLASSHRQFTQTTKIFNYIAVILISINIINLVFGSWQLRSLESDLLGNLPDWSATQVNNPDIYFIVFDRYASPANLTRFYNFDNQSFVDDLKNRGFSVSSNAHSNYPTTLYSLSSTLNMSYLTNLTDKYGINATNKRPLYHLLENHAVGRYLQGQNYQYVHIGSWWGGTKQNNNADFNYSLLTPSDFTMLLFRISLFSAIGEQLNFNEGGFLLLMTNPAHYQHAQYQFEQLLEIPKKPEPTFTLAHFLLPHPPYVFSPTGEFLPQEITDTRSNSENYINQLLYTNQQIISLVDQVISNSSSPPIIILQSDEGPYPENFLNQNYQEKTKIKWPEATDEEIQIKTGILSALYLPPELADQMTAPSTPINTFRTLFSILFNADLPPISESIYIFADSDHPFQFQDATSRITTE
ncbi:MAG: sulfatase-like hydrolase/transferase [bacterium]